MQKKSRAIKNHRDTLQISGLSMRLVTWFNIRAPKLVVDFINILRDLSLTGLNLIVPVLYLQLLTKI